MEFKYKESMFFWAERISGFIKSEFFSNSKYSLQNTNYLSYMISHGYWIPRDTMGLLFDLRRATICRLKIIKHFCLKIFVYNNLDWHLFSIWEGSKLTSQYYWRSFQLCNVPIALWLYYSIKMNICLQSS